MEMQWNQVRVRNYKPEHQRILTEDALALLALLVDEFSRARMVVAKENPSPAPH